MFKKNFKNTFKHNTNKKKILNTFRKLRSRILCTPPNKVLYFLDVFQELCHFEINNMRNPGKLLVSSEKSLFYQIFFVGEKLSRKRLAYV